MLYLTNKYKHSSVTHTVSLKISAARNVLIGRCGDETTFRVYTLETKLWRADCGNIVIIANIMPIVVLVSGDNTHNEV